MGAGGMVRTLLALAVVVAALAARDETYEDDDFVEFDPASCPNKKAEEKANKCIALESGMGADALASLTIFLTKGPGDLTDDQKGGLCSSLNAETTSRMKRCKEKSGCRPELICTLGEYRNLRLIGCSEKEAKYLCEQVYTEDPAEVENSDEYRKVKEAMQEEEEEDSM